MRELCDAFAIDRSSAGTSVMLTFPTAGSIADVSLAGG
jgi:hypothetical protein